MPLRRRFVVRIGRRSVRRMLGIAHRINQLREAMLQIQMRVLLMIFTNAAAQQLAIAEFNGELENCRRRQRQRERRMGHTPGSTRRCGSANRNVSLDEEIINQLQLYIDTIAENLGFSRTTNPADSVVAVVPQRLQAMEVYFLTVAAELFLSQNENT